MQRIVHKVYNIIYGFLNFLKVFIWYIQYYKHSRPDKVIILNIKFPEKVMMKGDILFKTDTFENSLASLENKRNSL